MRSSFSETTVEIAALVWPDQIGWRVAHGPDIAAGEPGAERRDPGYRDVVLERRLDGTFLPSSSPMSSGWRMRRSFVERDAV
ncbi:MAG TPA: hypothetical protein VJB15_08575 [Rhodothermia bacterium]|nr:hypothetical protein [Rhodothermia bacterium]